jgi:hypothetical protein
MFFRRAAQRLRYPLVGGTRERRFAGTNSKPRKLPKNAATPTTLAPAYFAVVRVHYPGVLPGRCVRQCFAALAGQAEKKRCSR